MTSSLTRLSLALMAPAATHWLSISVPMAGSINSAKCLEFLFFLVHPHMQHISYLLGLLHLISGNDSSILPIVNIGKLQLFFPSLLLLNSTPDGSLSLRNICRTHCLSPYPLLLWCIRSTQSPTYITAPVLEPLPYILNQRVKILCVRTHHEKWIGLIYVWD